jgi:ATP-binding cassette subfamily B protein
VLDDVSSARDVETEHQLWDRLLADGRTGGALLVASNRPATIARADQVIHLDQGRRLDAHPIYKDVVKEAHFCPCA